MNRTPVKSTNVAYVGYDPEKQILEVEFHGGNVYQYYDVPETIFKELLNASSIGKYLNKRIKGVYRYKEV